MKITVDTNVLIRAVLDDDAEQSAVARSILAAADLVAISTVVLCELVWVLSYSYKKSKPEIASVIRAVLAAASVRTDGSMVEAGLRSLDAGGDFADGVIAFDGERLGGHTFVSFDRKAALIRRAQGGLAEVLASH